MSDKCSLPIDTTKPYEVVVVVFKHNYDNHMDNRTSIGQTSLWFKSTKEVLAWSDDAGVDFS